MIDFSPSLFLLESLCLKCLCFCKTSLFSAIKNNVNLYILNIFYKSLKTIKILKILSDQYAPIFNATHFLTHRFLMKITIRKITERKNNVEAVVDCGYKVRQSRKYKNFCIYGCLCIYSNFRILNEEKLTVA